MRKLLPDSIAGRTVLVLLIGLMLSHAISTAIYRSDRADVVTVLGASHVADRIATISRLVQDAPSEERPVLLKAVNSPTLHVVWQPTSAVPESAPQDWRARLMEETLRLHLGDLGRRDLRVAYNEPTGRSQSPDGALRFPMTMGGPAEMMQMMHEHMHRMGTDPALGRNLRVSVRLPDASWLNFAAPLGQPASFWSARVVLSVAVMVLAVIALTIWAVRRFAAPLTTFAKAAERLGRDVNASPLPEGGPREVRRVTLAFNEMQRRIRRFVEDRTQMVAAISHDLRTPITRLRLRAEFVEDHEQREKMLADLDDMERMISSTLSFASEDAAGEPPETVDLTALLQSICDDLADTGRAVEFRGEGRLPYRCRPVALRRAFANLIENAVTYGGRARVAAVAKDDGIFVRIDDEGPGIPEEDKEKVFRPFYRLDESRSRETGGTGLGLSVARTVVRAHGGNIELTNRPEGGLRVEVTLPR